MIEAKLNRGSNFIKVEGKVPEVLAELTELVEEVVVTVYNETHIEPEFILESMSNMILKKLK